MSSSYDVKVFTDEEVEILRKNRYVKSITRNRIAFTDEFKECFLDEYRVSEQRVEDARRIFRKYDLRPEMIGYKRIVEFSYQTRKLRDEKLVYENRRKTCKTDHSQQLDTDSVRELEKLRHEVAYLRQETVFLKKLLSNDGGRKQQ